MTKCNILIATHGDLGKSLIESCTMILGESENLESVSLATGMSPTDLIEIISEKLDSYVGDTLVFADLFGGTPANVVTVLSNKYDLKCISGVNLPMLLEAVDGRDSMPTWDFDTFANSVITLGLESLTKFGFKKGEMTNE